MLSLEQAKSEHKVSTVEQVNPTMVEEHSQASPKMHSKAGPVEQRVSSKEQSSPKKEVSPMKETKQPRAKNQMRKQK